MNDRDCEGCGEGYYPSMSDSTMPEKYCSVDCQLEHVQS
jgi:hypothetical protein